MAVTMNIFFALFNGEKWRLNSFAVGAENCATLKNAHVTQKHINLWEWEKLH